MGPTNIETHEQNTWKRLGEKSSTQIPNTSLQLAQNDDELLNPRLTVGGGVIRPPPQANSQTNDRSETGEAALERSRRDGSKTILNFFLKGHVSGQGQVNGQN